MCISAWTMYGNIKLRMECYEKICLEKRGVTFWEETSGVKRECKRIVR